MFNDALNEEYNAILREGPLPASGLTLNLLGTLLETEEEKN